MEHKCNQFTLFWALGYQYVECLECGRITDPPAGLFDDVTPWEPDREYMLGMMYSCGYHD